MTLVLKVNRQGQVIYFNFFEIPDLRNVKIDTEINSASQLQVLLRKGQVEESLTSNFKVIRQGHVIYFSIFGFYNLDFVENNTNLITLSHLHQKISRLTNNGKNSVF